MPFNDVFELTGDGPRFMQELGDFPGGAEKSVDALLVESPGDQSVRENKDFFVKEVMDTAFSLPAAAMALVTLQTYSPAGGRGHLTSIRGGGPLTTLLVVESPKFGNSLWGRIWPNVPDGEPATAEDLREVFPWLSPMRTSEKGNPRLTPEDVHPLQVYWWMPRRIRIEIDNTPSRCAVLNTETDVSVRRYRTLQYGMKAADGTFEHPLCPYTRAKEGKAPRPVLASPARTGYPSWPGTVVTSDDRLRTPALCIRRWPARSSHGGLKCRFAAYGFNMDNAKPLGWVESEDSLWRGFGGHGHDEMEDLIGRLARAAFLVRGETTRRVKDGLATRPADLKGDFGHLGEELYRDTYPAFRQAVAAAADLVAVPDEGEDDDRTDHIRLDWAKTLERAALAVFDRHVPVFGSAAGDIRRQVKARYDLTGFLRGVTKAGGTQLFEKALGLPSPQKLAQTKPAGVQP